MPVTGLSPLGYQAANLLQGSGRYGVEALYTNAHNMIRSGALVSQQFAQRAHPLVGHYRDAMNSLLGFTSNPANVQWHHLVEQSLQKHFPPSVIQSIVNVVPTKTAAHQKVINATYNARFAGNQNFRQYLEEQVRLGQMRYEHVHRIGLEIWAEAEASQAARLTRQELLNLVTYVKSL